MGLIAKAVNKVEEKKQEPPVIPETPEVPEAPKRGRKRRFLLLGAPLVLIGVVSALGYLLFLKPSPQAPPEIIHRSISARKKAANSSPEATGKKEDRRTPNLASEKESQGTKNIKERTPHSPKLQEKTDATSKGEKKPVIEKATLPIQKVEPLNSLAQEKSTSTPSSSEAISLPLNVEAVSPDKEPVEDNKMDDVQKEQVAVPDEEHTLKVVSEPLPKFEGKEEKPEILGPPFVQPEDTREVSDLQQDVLIPSGDIPSESELQSSELDMEEMGTPSFDESSTEQMIQVPLSKSTETKTQRGLKVSDRSESHAERYYKKGVSYQLQGELSKAIDSYRRALNYNPDHLQANINLATAYLQVGRFKQAEQILVYLYASRPKDSRVLYNFAVLLYHTGEHASAENKLNRILQIDPFHVEANLLLSTIYEDKGKLDKAIEACMRAHRINSAHPQVLYRLGRLWDLAGELVKAAMYYRQFLNCPSEKEGELEMVVRDRFKYLGSRKEE